VCFDKWCYYVNLILCGILTILCLVMRVVLVIKIIHKVNMFVKYIVTTVIKMKVQTMYLLIRPTWPWKPADSHFCHNSFLPREP